MALPSLAAGVCAASLLSGGASIPVWSDFVSLEPRLTRPFVIFRKRPKPRQGVNRESGFRCANSEREGQAAGFRMAARELDFHAEHSNRGRSQTRRESAG